MGAKGGVLCLQEASEEVHPHHRMYQGAQGALCPRWLWLQAGSRGVLRQNSDRCAGCPQGAVYPGTSEECVDVPKEVCTRSRTNPRPVKKPVVKKWCYVPSEESASPKLLLQLKIPSQDNNKSLSLPFESIFIIDLLYHSEPSLSLNRQLFKTKILA